MVTEVVSAQRPSANTVPTAPMWWMPVAKGAAIEGVASTAASCRKRMSESQCKSLNPAIEGVASTTASCRRA